MQCDREGTFRAQIKGYGIRDADGSQSVGVVLQVLLLELWNGTAWDEWEQYEMEAEGTLWVVKKNGEINQSAAESLTKYAGWDGSFSSLFSQTWQPTKCQVVVKRDDYKGEVRYRVEFVNGYDRTPGAVSSVSESKARELETRYGSQFRAIAGNSKRNGPAPAAPANGGKPAPPPSSSRPTPPPPANQTEDIPF
jgi:hypothetical protein